ncbi:MAG: ATP-binding protein [Chloroflexota bacterium]|nr:MAG: ATP-binding protein [Chloroflexota bacterium]
MTQESMNKAIPDPPIPGEQFEDSACELTGGTVPPCIGRVASPVRFESTSGRFFFWVPQETLVEKTQLVHADSSVGGRQITYYGVVEEVYRRSRRRSIDEEMDAFDGDLDYEPPFALEGVTFAEATILGTDPPFLTPPVEQSAVFLSSEAEAGKAYDYESMTDVMTQQDWSLPIGLLRNGGAGTVGVARIDLRDLCGDRAGHMNVTGQAGHGTKSSFLLVILRSLIDLTHRWDDGNPEREPFSVRPIVFNVKGNDLMFIDARNRHLDAKGRALWERMGVSPQPFTGAQFFAPCSVGSGPVNRGVARVLRPCQPQRQTHTYYWTLSDVIRFGLWSFLFSEETQSSESMMAMLDHVLGEIAEDCNADHEHPAGLQLRSGGGVPQSFAELVTWLRGALRDPDHPARDHRIHAFATCRALLSRLGLILEREGESIFDHGTGWGRPLRVLAQGTTDPLVIDIALLPNDLRRFVVAAVLHQVKEHQMRSRIPGQVYFLVLDELGLYAPRGARDPITRLFEHVAAQLRSQGIILLGAQQHASRISETIFGNSEIKAVGASSPVELETPTWSNLLSRPQKARALTLRPEEKMVLMSRGWMNIVVPFPAWAMKEAEADRQSLSAADLQSAFTDEDNHGTTQYDFPLNLPEG